MALPVAGYSSTINVGGTSTATTAEATSLFSGAGANTVRQITNAAKRCMDPAVAVVVKDGVTTLTFGTQYVLDYLYGKIRFLSYTPVGAITADFSYIPLLPVVGCKAFNLDNAGRQKLDVTIFTNGVEPGGESSIAGKKSASGTIEYVNSLLDDHDTGAGVQRLWDFISNGVVFLLDAQYGPSTSLGGFRAWVRLFTTSRSFSQDSIVGTKLGWSATSGTANSGTIDDSKDAWFAFTETQG